MLCGAVKSSLCLIDVYFCCQVISSVSQCGDGLCAGPGSWSCADVTVMGTGCKSPPQTVGQTALH